MEQRHKDRYGEIAKTILLGVGIAGTIVVIAVAPGVVLAAKLFALDQGQFPNKKRKQKIGRTFKRLERKRLLKVKKKNAEFVIELTKEGKRVFKQVQIEKLQIPKPPQWDKKWRLVIFDIPEEEFRAARGILRAKLKEWEFYPLQKSVWVCPWPCENEIQAVTELYEILPYVEVIVAEKIANDENIRKHFAI
jgi:DNA-binding transcriptional regulator PaaX